MDLSNLLEAGAGGAASQNSTSKSFREADFLAVMLTEITHQDPFQPTETAKMVEQMQQLQSLANSNFEKYRGDLAWAQELIGKQITVQQAALGEEEISVLAERGINVDPGYGTVNGTVETYRTIGETVWVTVDGKDYPIDNVQRISPAGPQAGQMATVADGLLGRKVTWYASDPTQAQTGQVSDITWGSDGSVDITVGGERIPFNFIRSIGN